uniref:DUF4817 domain-containing protein n=1 Tax=Strongyloides papillosus TaxID=174720 RepID=A0A0N5BMI6_STREA
MRYAPTRQTIKNIVKRFNKHGSVGDVHRRGRPLRKNAQQLCMARSTLHNVIKHKIKFFSYKSQDAQELLPVDKNQRKEYATKIKELVEKDCNFIDKLIMDDETNFYLNEKSEGKKGYSMMWYIIKKKFGPYFFEDKKDDSVTINSQRYCDMLENFVAFELESFPKDTWFQQYGASSHTAARTIKLFKKIW